ncbi:GPP34 family phosphoprotein [Glycomyces luteolus]|uniref:GPP34 family phosphoprotein n=1 Tax=Glycomyces luteolus TaxID=2670330 RepID=A0A9X3PAY3_9ACTN|nr:GPP34 family phosphoprotein [Glycomyces luteolus]MDA1361329.1 GPP34 family phosphoprotein [Glycomyces luteolus]
MSTLREELALLSYESANGRASTYLDLGLGGAVLYELALAGRIGLDGKKVRVLDPTSTGDPVLDARLAAIAADKPRSPHAVVERTAKGLLPTVRDGLVASGALRHERTKSLRIFTVNRYRSSDRNATADARTRLASAARNGRAFDERTQALLSLVAAVRLEKSLFPDRQTRPSRKEIKAFAEAHWVGTATRRAVANRDGANAAATSSG